jgi:hypothetical protein
MGNEINIKPVECLRCTEDEKKKYRLFDLAVPQSQTQPERYPKNKNGPEYDVF